MDTGDEDDGDENVEEEEGVEHEALEVPQRSKGQKCEEITAWDDTYLHHDEAWRQSMEWERGRYGGGDSEVGDGDVEMQNFGDTGQRAGHDDGVDEKRPAGEEGDLNTASESNDWAEVDFFFKSVASLQSPEHSDVWEEIRDGKDERQKRREVWARYQFSDV